MLTVLTGWTYVGAGHESKVEIYAHLRAWTQRLLHLSQNIFLNNELTWYIICGDSIIYRVGSTSLRVG